MSEICIVTGSAGLIGSDVCRHFASKGMTIVGIDNNMRKKFFGNGGSTKPNRQKLTEYLGENYIHNNIDIRNAKKINNVFKKYSNDIKCIIHTAAQPSHDWPAKNVNGANIDFSVNAVGTLNMLEATKEYCPKSTFIFTSTNKVYGDTPNGYEYKELETRWELPTTHQYYKFGVDESMSIDQSKHSIFGASKIAADILVQEYGRYFDMNTGVFRGGCLTGSNHASVELHGFLSYLVKCIINEKEYNIFGWNGKQVRDNIHSYDVASAFWTFHSNPKKGEVYNIGGTRYSNCSMKEAISKIEEYSGKKGIINYVDENRSGDHKWWISSMEKFKNHYPEWNHTYDINHILEEIVESNIKKITK